MAERFVAPSGADPTFSEIARVSDLNNVAPEFTPELAAFISVRAGDFRRLSPRSGGMTIALETPDSGNIGKSVALYVLAGQGSVKIQCSGFTIDGVASITFSAGRTRMIRLWSDGSTGWSTEWPGIISNDDLLAAQFSITGRPGSGSGPVSDIPVGQNTVVGRVTGDIVAAQLVTSQITPQAITEATIADLAVGVAKLGNDTMLRKLLTDPYWFDDCEQFTAPTTTGTLQTSTRNWRMVVTGGTWTLTQPAFAGAIGVIRFATNTNTTTVQLFDTIAGAAPFRWENFRSVVMGVRLRTAITAVRLFCGVFTTGGAAAVFDYDQAVSVNLRAVTRSGGGAGTSDATTGTVWAAGDYHHLRIDRNGNDLEFYVDGTLTNTVLAATHGIVTADPLNVFWQWGRGTTVAEVELDYVGFRGKRTA